MKNLITETIRIKKLMGIINEGGWTGAIRAFGDDVAKLIDKEILRSELASADKTEIKNFFHNLSTKADDAITAEDIIGEIKNMNNFDKSIYDAILKFGAPSVEEAFARRLFKDADFNAAAKLFKAAQKSQDTRAMNSAMTVLDKFGIEDESQLLSLIEKNNSAELKEKAAAEAIAQTGFKTDLFVKMDEANKFYDTIKEMKAIDIYKSNDTKLQGKIKNNIDNLKEFVEANKSNFEKLNAADRKECDLVLNSLKSKYPKWYSWFQVNIMAKAPSWMQKHPFWTITLIIVLSGGGVCSILSGKNWVIGMLKNLCGFMGDIIDWNKEDASTPVTPTDNTTTPDNTAPPDNTTTPDNGGEIKPVF
jgi:hypothetical protein